MKRLNILTLVTVFVMLFSITTACNLTPAALRVGKINFSRNDLEKEIAGLAKFSTELSGPYEESYKGEFVAGLLHERLVFLIAEQANNDRGVIPTASHREQAKELLAEQFQIDPSQFVQKIGPYGESSIDGMASILALQEALYLEAVDAGFSTISLQEQIYEQSKSQYVSSCAHHIMIFSADGAIDPITETPISPTPEQKVIAEKKINEIAQRLAAGESFEKIATETSDDTVSAVEGGDVGCAVQGSYVEAFDDAVWSQAVGEIGKPVETPYGYHIIRVDSRTDAPPFEELQPEIAETVSQELGQRLFTAFINEKYAKQDFSVDPRFGTWNSDERQIQTPQGADPLPGFVSEKELMVETDQ